MKKIITYIIDHIYKIVAIVLATLLLGAIFRTCNAQQCDGVLKIPVARRVAFQSVTPAPAGYTKTVSIYIETDNDMYVHCGSDTNKVRLFVNSWFEQWRRLYLRDSILIRIDSIGYWRTIEPYNWSSSSQVLMDFGARMVTSNPTADACHFVSIKNNGFGGVSYVGGIGSAGYNVSFSHIYTSWYTVPLYSWTVEVLAHESGHMFGGQHTHNCYWQHPNGTVSPIDSLWHCEGGCCVQTPTQSGTILSYGHLTQFGIDFNKGFGQLPLTAIKQYIWNCYNNGLLKMPDVGLCFPPYVTAINTTTQSADIHYGSQGQQYKYRYRAAGQAWNAAVTTTLSNIFISGLQSNKVHYFQIKTKVNGVESAWSTKYKFKTN